MWSNLPSDILTYIFSFLSPDSLACAASVSIHWHACATARPLQPNPVQRHPRQPWLLALPTRQYHHPGGPKCYIFNPDLPQWYALPLTFLPNQARPVTAIEGLVLSRSASSTCLQLDIFNPFTKQVRHLPQLRISRTNPAIGVVQLGPIHYRVYVAGGTSSSVPHDGTTYQSSLEMYDSLNNQWRIKGAMPMEFAVRLTVWTPNESVVVDGVLYWITSARAYSIVGFEIESDTWMELGVPVADKLEFATLVRRKGKLTLLGATAEEGISIWELMEDKSWNLVETLPIGLRLRFLGEKKKRRWSGTKCVGGDGVVWLYTDLGSGMIAWREDVCRGRWDWHWFDGCCSIKGKAIANLAIRGVLLHPDLSLSI